MNYDGKSEKADNSLGREDPRNDDIGRAMIAFKAALVRMDANPGAASRIRRLADVTDDQLAEEVPENVRNLAAPPAGAPARAEAPTQAVDDTYQPGELAGRHSVDGEHPAAAANPGAHGVYATRSKGSTVLRRLHEWVSSWGTPQDYLAGLTFRLQLEIPRAACNGIERLSVALPTPVSFWDLLDPTEREVLRSMASQRKFTAGARIMAEGERADHVMVILAGLVKVGVHESGAERVLAIRGTGQLVGERAVLQAGLRSASVVALDTVSGLVVRTNDFAAFIGAHPRVLSLVQNLLDHGDIDKQRRSSVLTGENCTVLLTDVVGFGTRSRTDGDRRLIRKTLFQMTQAALQGMPDARSEDRGDGILTVVPPNVSTMKVVGRFLEKLPAALELHNRTQPEPARFKLRLAVSVGPVVSDMGVSGEAIIVAARLVDAPRFKEAVAGSAASLGVIVSPFVYETVIRHSMDPREAASYSQVLVEVKESITMAWMKL